MIITKIMKYCCWFLLTIFFWIFAIQNIPAEFTDLGGDSAQYIILAESITQGKGLRMLNYPQEPFSSYYPPIFPLSLSPIVYFWGRNFYLMHLLVALLGYMSLFFLYPLFKKYSDDRIASLTIGIFALNWVFIAYSAKSILSDIPYLFFSSLALFFCSCYFKKTSFFNKKGLGLIFGLVLSYLTRYIGLTLFLGIIVSLLLNSKEDKLRAKKIIFITGGFLLVFIIWAAWKHLNHLPQASHLKELFLIDPRAPYKDNLLVNPLYYLSRRFVEGVNYHYDLFVEIFFFPLPEKYAFLKDLLGGPTIILLFLGLWWKFRENKSCPFHYYFILYLLLIIFWPFREGVRFIVPILPFIFFYFFSGLHRTLHALFKKIAYRADDLYHKKFSLTCFYLLICIFFICNIFHSIVMTKSTPAKLNELPSPLRNFILLHQWIKLNLPRDGIIFSRKPTITYFYTEHKAILYPYTSSPEEIWQVIEKNGVKYIVVDEFSLETYRYLLPFLYKYENGLKLLYRIGNTGLFKLLRIAKLMEHELPRM